MPDIFRTEGYSSGILLGRTSLASWFALGLFSGRAAATWYQGYHLHPPHPPPHAANAALACCQWWWATLVACFLSIMNSHRLSGCMRIKTRSVPLLASKAGTVPHFWQWRDLFGELMWFRCVTTRGQCSQWLTMCVCVFCVIYALFIIWWNYYFFTLQYNWVGCLDLRNIF